MANTTDSVQELLDYLKSKEAKTDEKSITISADERRLIEKLTGKNLTTGVDLIRILQRCLQVSANGIEIPLTPFLLERLQSRAIRVPFEPFLQQTIKRCLEEFCGLR